MEEVNWGIIGCGNVTEMKSGPAFNKVPHSKLVAVMRRDAEKAADYAQRHQVPKFYTDATALINDPEVNAIYIATPPLQHEAYTLQVLAAGKPVYVEKPMAIDSKAAQNMTAAADKHQVKLSIAHYRRAQPMFLKIKELLEENTIGSISFVKLEMYRPAAPAASHQNNWRIDPTISGGGLFHDLAPHQLDLMYYFFGDIEKSTGMATKSQKNSPVDDVVSGQLLFKNGVLFNGIWCFATAEGEQSDLCEIHGEMGKISFPMFGHTVKVTVNGIEQVYPFEPLMHVQQPMIEQVVAYFLGKGPNPCSGKEATVSMQLMADFTTSNA